MVWVDSVQNPFRQLIIPLALQSPALMMAILSFAAGDMWTRSQSILDPMSGSYRLMKRYHQGVLSLLAKHMKDENEQKRGLPDPAPSKDYASPTLAAFMLSSLNVKLGDSRAWRLHARATWAMIEHWNACASKSPPSTDQTRVFALREVYAFKAWESVTTFIPLESLYRKTSVVDDGGPFIKYVKTILTLSDFERRRFENCETSNVISLSELRVWLDEAQSSNRSYAAQNCHSVAARESFEHVVELFHHAGLLYGCQILPEEDDADGFAVAARVNLFKYLEQIAVTEVIAQDLTWPIFIAGTECQGCPEKQRLVEERLQEIMKLSGVLERPKLLTFLKHLWVRQGETYGSSWIDLARTYAANGEPILIV
ncbi:hypothetical protein A1O1_05701 [Capronia coronata CBS 617.96]|uniref:Uncharacterized protein n=1 Tax=Capronia coronata CBS 617.96 TaxID=1182541 RepID=W9XXV9_9EURO|nr:uncharacterized protein A1O1_05701 [Capronia coronata CBS 617.96]EXJ85337.1 hypothetical protein A1O1_05701 [Capronia coronata CBS 617.96]